MTKLLFISLFFLTSCSVAKDEIFTHLEGNQINFMLNAAKKSAFDDGKFSISSGLKEWITDIMVVDPTVGKYLEMRSHSLYFAPDMKTFKYVSSVFINGTYDGRAIHNEIVRICRAEANLEVNTESIYLAPTFNTPGDKFLTSEELKGYTTYRVRVQEGATWISKNYVANSMGLANKWRPFKNTSWTRKSEKNILERDLSGDFDPDLDIQIGFSVYLLLKFNGNTITAYTLDKRPSNDNPSISRLYLESWDQMVVLKSN